jgi:hypothetical protein
LDLDGIFKKQTNRNQTSVSEQVLWVTRHTGIIPGNIALKLYGGDPFLKAGWRADISAEAAAQVPSWARTSSKLGPALNESIPNRTAEENAI